jgi:hypothetical protein
LVNSGISAPATVPQLMIMESTHQRLGSALPAMAKFPRSIFEARKVTPMETADVSHTRWVSGASKSKSFLPPNIALLITSLIR